MCLGAIYWARPDRLVYACTRHDAAAVNFDDAFIYDEIKAPIKKRQIKTEQVSRDEALVVFKKWQEKMDKTAYWRDLYWGVSFAPNPKSNARELWGEFSIIPNRQYLAYIIYKN